VDDELPPIRQAGRPAPRICEACGQRVATRIAVPFLWLCDQCEISDAKGKEEDLTPAA